MNRQRLGWILIVLILLQSGGYLVSVRLMQYSAKLSAQSVINAGIPKSGLVTFTATQIEGATWSEDDEFQWKGAMFDVVEVQRTADGPLYICYHDAKETAVKQLMAVFTEHDNDGWTTTFSTILLSSVYISTIFPNMKLSDLASIRSVTIFHKKDIYDFLKGGPTPPPPRFI